MVARLVVVVIQFTGRGLRFNKSSTRRSWAATVGPACLDMGVSPHSARFRMSPDYLRVLEKTLTANKHQQQPRLQIMKHLIPVAIAAFVLVGCDQQKTAIDDKKEATKSAIDNRKDAVDVAATAAKKQAEVDAAVEKAKIEASQAAALRTYTYCRLS